MNLKEATHKKKAWASDLREVLPIRIIQIVLALFFNYLGNKAPLYAPFADRLLKKNNGEMSDCKQV